MHWPRGAIDVVPHRTGTSLPKPAGLAQPDMSQNPDQPDCHY